MRSNMVKRFAIVAAIMLMAFSWPSHAQQKGGANELRIAVPQEPPVADICAIGSNAAARVLFANVGEGLTERVVETGEVRPLLATAWKQLSPMVWEFTLRKGVVFHDGTPFNAQTAATSVNRTFLKQLNCSVATQAFGAVRLTAEAVGDSVLRLTTAVEDPILPLRTAFLGMTSPNTPTDKPTARPIGTGPYKFASWERGTRLVLDRHDKYWGKAPQFERVTYLFRGEDLVRAEMINAGEADIAVGLPFEFQKYKGAVMFDVPETLGVRIHIQSPPFNNKKVREAVKLAIDRQGIIKAVWSGAGKVASQPIPPDALGFDPKYPSPAYNPDAARKLIAQAKAEGAPVGTPSIIYTRLDILENGDLLAQALAQQLNNIGLNVKVQILEAAPWIEILRSRPTNRPGFLLEPHGNILGDASWTANSKYHSSQPRSQVPDELRPTVDQMIRRAGAARGEERARLYRELFAYLDREVIQDVFIAHTRSVMIVGPGVQYTPNIQSDDIIRVASITKKR